MTKTKSRPDRKHLKPIPAFLCSEEVGGEHLLVSATPTDLSSLGLWRTGCRYDDGVATWQGSRDAINKAYERYGLREAQ